VARSVRSLCDSEDVADASMSSGRAPARLADVAATAGVSEALASRVLNGDATVRASEGTRDRIRRAADEHSYVPNRAARALRTRRTGLLGLIVHDLTSPVYVEFLAGARAEAEARGASLLLGDADQLMANPASFRDLVGSGRVDGIIIQAGHSDFDERIADIAAALPTLVMNAPVAGVASVYPDDAAATRLLTEHLVDTGRRDIALVIGPRDATTSRVRAEGWRAALATAGLPIPEHRLLSGDWSAGSGTAAFASLWDGGPRPDAVIGGNVIVATGLLAAAIRSGVDVPGELAVVGIQDAWFADYLTPALTTVELPQRAVGARAVAEILDHPGHARHVLIDAPAPVLHVRASG
jgi:LacI family transcriptional regulator